MKLRLNKFIQTLSVVVILSLFVDAEVVQKKCWYRKGAWSDCDKSTNTRTRTLTLRDDKQSGKDCPQNDVKTGRCRGCRYSRGEWSECDDSNMKNRKDTLKVEKSSSDCDPFVVRQKRCKRKCKYTVEGIKWSACNLETGLKTRTARLRVGQHAQCEQTKLTTRSCQVAKSKKRNKKRQKQRQALCQYSDWSEWSECNGGTKTKTRKLIEGEAEKCHKQLTKNKSCKN